ncbi:hypothetical protein F4782DRAFT_50690 [Xylaria castorea]|nr:hypothetical protein F4782DRAFT_50690 [Xylaria castorea]
MILPPFLLFSVFLLLKTEALRCESQSLARALPCPTLITLWVTYLIAPSFLSTTLTAQRFQSIIPFPTVQPYYLYLIYNGHAFLSLCHRYHLRSVGLHVPESAYCMHPGYKEHQNVLLTLSAGDFALQPSSQSQSQN